MAWNPSPEVAIARDVAKKLDDAKAVVVIYITKDGSKCGSISYGKDKETCEAAKHWSRKLHDVAMDEIVKRRNRGEEEL